MEDLTDVIDYASWSDTSNTGNLPWNCCTDGTTMNTMNIDASCRAAVPRNTVDMSTMYGYAGGLLERQGLISQDYGMQGSQTQSFIHNRVLNYPHSDDIFFGHQSNQSPHMSSLSELNSHFQSHPRVNEPVTDAIFQSFSRDGMPIDINSLRKRQAYTDVSKLTITNQDRIQQNKCNGQYARPQPQAAPGGPTKPRTRARRGQATDPHSIAERLRRERIANRLKLLQDLVPNSNKPDKAAMLDDIIEYVRFLQLQAKVFGMSRLGGTGAVAPLVADVSTESHSSLGSSMLTNNISGGTGAPRDHNTEALEEEVANLMEADVSKAMRFLQSKGLCLMPVSLATAISRMDMRHSTDDSEVIY